MTEAIEKQVGAPKHAGFAAPLPAKASYPGNGLAIERVHTAEGVHPYAEVTWERRDVVMTNWRDG